MAHDDRWKDSIHEIGNTLTGLLADQPVVRISHIESTTIQGISMRDILKMDFKHDRDAYTDAKTDFIS